MPIGDADSPTKEEYSASMIKEPKIAFYPGSMLKQAKKSVSFLRIKGGEVAQEPPLEPENPDVV